MDEVDGMMLEDMKQWDPLDLIIFTAIRDYNLMSMVGKHHQPPSPAVKVIMESFHLESLLDYFVERNLICSLPYHNTYHTYCMVLNCYEGGCHEGISQSHLKALLVAALFHDYNHFGGKQPDDVNVAEAIRCLKLALQACPVLTPEEEAVAINTVQITKYPYEGDPLEVTEMIIRDADLMQPYEERADVLLTQYMGLKAEVEISRKTIYTPAEFGEGNHRFLGDRVWHTRWAADKAVRQAWEEKKLTLKNLLTGVR